MSHNTVPHGWIVIDKPEGISSHDVVFKVRRHLGVKKVGHAGTLDPLASGLLPLAIGEATKLVPYLMETKKTYLFDVTWGEERTTDDREGEIAHHSPLRPSEEEIQASLPRFEGDVLQTPPLYSAIKIGGTRACDKMRRGETVALEPRVVKIEKIHLMSMVSKDCTRFSMRCGKGTYVRSVARDMGRLLQCYGYVSFLRRTMVGRFGEGDAIPLKKFLAQSPLSLIRQCIHPMVSALDDIPVVTVGQDAAVRLLKGQQVILEKENLEESSLMVCLDRENVPIGICTFSCGVLKPKRMFHLT